MFNNTNTAKKSSEILWNVRMISQRTDEILDSVKEAKGTRKKFTAEVAELACMNRTLVNMMEEHGRRLEANGEKIEDVKKELGKLVYLFDNSLAARTRRFFARMKDYFTPGVLEKTKAEEQMSMIARVGLYTYPQ